MLIGLDDYIDRAVDPDAPFVPIESDELLENAELDPSLDPPPELLGGIAQAWTTNALRLQQTLVFRVGANLGVLKPLVPKVLGALQSLPSISSLASAEMIVQALATGIGVATDAMAVVPLIGSIVKGGFVGAELGFRVIAAMDTPGTMIGKMLPKAQKYSTNTDAGQVRGRFLAQASSRNWSSLFLPPYSGKLAAQVRKAEDGRLVVAWGLRDDGVVPRIVIDDRPLFDPYVWHFSNDGGDRIFTPTGGMGAVPGAPRIVAATQCTVLQFQNIHRGHETLGDPRCGSSKKIADINVGLFYPNSANGAWSLYGYATKPSPSTFAIDAQKVLAAWEAYADAIWEGVDRLWRNESWESGWGCGLWQNMLQGLVSSHCVGADNAIGGFGAWMPPQGGNFNRKLNASDRDAWEANNFVTQIVKPAMQSLREMQLELLRETPMAGYLPKQGLGAMTDSLVADEFGRARMALLHNPKRSERLLLTDVVDDGYLAQLKVRHRGTLEGDGGIRYDDYKPPRMPMPDGASGGDGEGGGGGVVVLGALVALGFGVRQYLRSRGR